MPPVTFSPSQLDVYLKCPRRWWFSSVRKMPERHDPTNFASRAFGIAMHACFERWLLADDTGRNPDGTPVDPFPEGWDVVEERSRPAYHLDAGQRQQARELFGLCTRMGVVRRIPGRRVEDAVEVDCDGVAVRMVVDQWSADVVEDHKSTSKKKYALNSEELAADPKMRCYARWWFVQHLDAGTCRLRLNYFATKEQAPPWAVEAVVTREEVARWWDEVVRQTVREVVDYRSRNLTDDQWSEVEGPREDGICQKYGREGCPYAPVCGGTCSPEELRRRNQPKEVRGSDMGLGKKIVEARAAAPAAAVATPEQVPDATVAEPVAAVEAPPWHAKQCQACVKTPGINSKGHPCRACDNYAMREGRPGSAAYVIAHDATGTLTWTLRAGDAPADPNRGASQPVVQTPTPTSAPTEAPKRTRRTKAEMEAARAAEAPAPTSPAPTPSITVLNVTNEVAPQTSTSGKDAVLAVTQPGFILFLNALPLRQDYVDLTEVLLAEGRDLAKELGVESYYMLDAFKRRDMLASAITEVVKSLEGKNVVSLSPGPELKAYIEVLRPLAKMVIVGSFA